MYAYYVCGRVSGWGNVLAACTPHSVGGTLCGRLLACNHVRLTLDVVVWLCDCVVWLRGMWCVPSSFLQGRPA